MDAILRIEFPDWSALDTAARRALPFALWPVGEQALVCHWLDHAVNQEIDKVVIHTRDRPAELREALAGMSLWNMPVEVRTDDPPPGQALWGPRLPWQTGDAVGVADGWDLLRLRADLEKAWLEHFQSVCRDYGEGIAVGRLCQIHPTATLVAPYWIGDEVSVGPACVIGPNAVVGQGAVIDEGARVSDARVESNTYLGPHTDLSMAWLQGPVLLHHGNRARLDRLESFISGSVTEEDRGRRVPWRERALAWWVLWRLRARLLIGLRVPLSATPDVPILPWWAPRLAWLPLVMAGRMRLFGVLPRPAAQMERLPLEWRTRLENAPTGVFSLADTLGIHETTHEEEALHAVYQCLMDPEDLRATLKRHLRMWSEGHA